MPAPPPLGSAGEPAAPPADATLAERSRPAPAVLRFIDPEAMRREVPLRFPFVWDGAEVRAVTVRRLSVADVGTVMGDHPDGADLLDFYAAMTDLPVAVLRAMEDDDFQSVTEVARPMLPRFVAGQFSTPTSPAGAATPSPPRAG